MEIRPGLQGLGLALRDSGNAGAVGGGATKEAVLRPARRGTKPESRLKGGAVREFWPPHRSRSDVVSARLGVVE